MKFPYTHRTSRLLDLPNDILSCIFCNLALKEIGFIRQACSNLNIFVSGNKQLWMHLLNCEIELHALPLPRYTREIAEATAQDVMEWLKNGIVLNKSYDSGDNKTLIRTNVSMSVTWVRLARGRWCLIACSDLDSSQLIVWDLRKSFNVASFHLPASVVDGAIDETRAGVLIALTIGSKIASIFILELFTDGNAVCVRKLSEVPGASHIRLFHRPYIGFAVSNGDDTNPSILNWETGCARSFITPDPAQGLCINDEFPFCLKHGPCVGMCLWGNQVYALFPSKVVVFGDPRVSCDFNDDLLTSIQCIRIHHLDATYANFFVVNHEDHCNKLNHRPTMSLVVREGVGNVTNLLIRYEEAVKVPGKLAFFVQTDYLQLPGPDPTYNSEVPLMAVGHAGARMIALSINMNSSWSIPTLYIAQIMILTEESFMFGPATPLSTSDMPLLYEISCMDFDDGSGLLVFGTVSGEVCIRSFGSTLPPSSLKTDLPLVSQPSDFKERTPINLPMIYEIHDSDSSQHNKAKLIEEALRSWGTVSPAPQIPGWSSEWSNFQYIDQWMASFPRWGILDKVVELDTYFSTRVRTRLGTLGEIIPVLFDESKHYRVLFRIGDRLYYCKSAPGGDEEDEDPEFEYTDHDDILGMFPISYSQFLEADLSVMENLISEHRAELNLDNDRSDLANEHLFALNGMFHQVKKFLIEQHGEYPGDKVLEAWSKEDWDAVRFRMGNVNQESD